MSHQDAVLLDDSVEEAALDPAELFGAMPELRRYLSPERRDDEVGLRGLFERADALRLA
jgi:hypothetical protein